MRVLILTHFYYTHKGPVYGPAHSLASFLQRKEISYQMVAHPLVSGANSTVEIFRKEKLFQSKRGSVLRLPLPFKSLLEIFLTLSLTRKKNFFVVVGIDPLNAFAAIFLKMLRRTRRVVFYTVDYADQRFKNPLFNFFYHLLDEFCLKFSDEIWNVSTRIFEKRARRGIPVSKNFLIPNAPSFKEVRRLAAARVNRFDVMMVTGVTHTPVFVDTLRAIKSLVKKFSRLRLFIIGTGPYETSLRQRIKKMKLEKKVFFLGQLAHPQLMRTLVRGGLGLALYTNDFPWTYYGDSMKAREYLAAGLPVLITDIVSTADHIKQFKAGLVIKPKAEQIRKGIEAIIGSKKEWLVFRKNAILLAEKFDIDKVFSERLGEF